MIGNLFGQLFKFLRKPPVTLTPEESWVFMKLQELTKASSYDIITRAHRLYALAHTGKSLEDTIFAQAKFGWSKKPIHVSNPSALVELPPEAHNHTPLTIPLPRKFHTDALLLKFLRLSKCGDLRRYIGNALYFYYHLLDRDLKGQVIYIRTVERAGFRRVLVPQ